MHKIIRYQNQIAKFYLHFKSSSMNALVNISEFLDAQARLSLVFLLFVD